MFEPYTNIIKLDSKYKFINVAAKDVEASILNLMQQRIHTLYSKIVNLLIVVRKVMIDQLSIETWINSVI